MAASRISFLHYQKLHFLDWPHEGDSRSEATQRTILHLPKFFIIKNMSTITFLDIEFLTESLTT